MQTIAKLAWKETIYKRIFHIAIFMTLGYLIFYGIATHYFAKQLTQMQSLGNIGTNALEISLLSTQFLSIGLFFSSFITSLLSILACVGSISSEIESHQIDTILTRPIHRRDVIFGKCVGLGGLLIVYAILLFLGTISVNQFLGGIANVHLQWFQVLKAALLFAAQPLLLVILALFLSSRTTTINGGIILIILYGIGFVGGFVEQIGVIVQNQALSNIGILTSLIFPLDSIFRKMTIYLFDTANDPLSIASQGLFGTVSAPSNLMLIYSVFYGAIFLWLTVRHFQKRDV